jgi:hypothetical protein
MERFNTDFGGRYRGYQLYNEADTHHRIDAFVETMEAASAAVGSQLENNLQE